MLGGYIRHTEVRPIEEPKLGIDFIHNKRHIGQAPVKPKTVKHSTETNGDN
jgi:hypothetical protein